VNLGQTEEALALLQTLLAEHRKSGDVAGQQVVLEKMLAIDSERPDESRALAEVLASRGKTADAASAMRHALALLRLAERWEEAAEAARRVEMLDPTDAAVRQLRGEALARAGRVEEAITVFANLGTASQAEHDYLMAEMAWRAVIELAPAHTVAREQLATLLAAQGQTDEAVSLWLGLAETHRAAGETEAERRALLALTAAQPGNATAQRRLAALSIAAGDLEAAWQAYRPLFATAQERGDEETWRSLETEVLAASQDPRLRIELAALHVEAGRREAALALYEQAASTHRRAGAHASVRALCKMMLQIDPDHIPALEMIAEILPAQDESTAHTQRAVRRRLARAHSARGQTDKALPLLQALNAETPGDLEILMELALQHQRLGQQPDFEKVFGQAVKGAEGPTASATFLKMSERLLVDCPWRLLVRGRMAEVIFRGQSVGEHVDLLFELAADFEREQDIVHAAEIHEALLGALPAKVEHRMRFVEFLVAHGQHTRAVQELLALAAIHHDQGDAKREIRALEHARELDSDDAQVLHRLGSALLAQNARGRALEHLQRAALLARQQGRGGDLAELHRLILEIDPSDVTTRRALIDILQSEGRAAEAVEQSMLLADQCIAKGFLDLAAQCYRSVVQAQPSSLEAWHGLIDTYLQFGAEDDLLPDYLALARVYLGEGRHREAVQWFRRYLGLAPGDIAVRQEFIETYLKVGSELDLREEYLTMAELCKQAGRATEADVWQRKAERLGTKLSAPPPAPPSPAPGPRPQSSRHQRGSARSSLTAAGASRRRKQEESSPRAVADGRERLQQSLAQYRSHLENDPHNAKLHQQVAEILHHLGRDNEAYAHWVEASELLFKQQQWRECTALCERLVQMNPSDPRMRDRLSRAALMKAQMKELDSAIEQIDQGG
jgi:predicted Zn-dependent protease